MSSSDFDKLKFDEVCKKKYKEQGVFFLNAFWPEYHDKAEEIWKIVQKFIEVDKVNKASGTSVGELETHIIMEKFGEPMTVIQFREAYRKIDLNFDKKIGVVEYLVFKFNVSVKTLLSRPQGTSTNADLAKAQEELDKVQEEIANIEKEKVRLEQLSKEEGIKGLRAKNELAQLLSKDHTSLNKKIIDANLAVKRARKNDPGGQVAQGSLWWIEKELQEAQKYKPRPSGKVTEVQENVTKKKEIEKKDSFTRDQVPVAKGALQDKAISFSGGKKEIEKKGSFGKQEQALPKGNVQAKLSSFNKKPEEKPVIKKDPAKQVKFVKKDPPKEVPQEEEQQEEEKQEEPQEEEQQQEEPQEEQQEEEPQEEQQEEPQEEEPQEEPEEEPEE